MSTTAVFDRQAPADDGGLPDELAHRRVSARFRPWRWISSLVVLLLLAQFAYGLKNNDRLEWNKFWEFFTDESILGFHVNDGQEITGVALTLIITAASAAFGLLGGIVLALARLSGNPLLSGLSWLYTWVFRALPLQLLIIFVYNLYYFWPQLGLGVPFGPTFFDVQTGGRGGFLTLNPVWVGIIGLSVNEAAFAAEVVRGGVLSVEHGQVEAAKALGLSRPRQLRRVILPQALRSIVPAYGNQLVGLVKASTLVTYASLQDLFGRVFTLESRFPESVIIILIVGAAWYLIITAVLSIIQFYVERYFARGAVRSLPPTPIQRLRTFSVVSWNRMGVRLPRRGL